MNMFKPGFSTVISKQTLIMLFAIVYGYVYVCFRVLGEMRVWSSTGRKIWSLENCYLVNYRELRSAGFPEAFKIRR